MGAGKAGELPRVVRVVPNVWSLLVVPMGFVSALVMAVALLPLTASTFVYALVEQRHRIAWTRAPAPPQLGSGPYRRSQLAVPRMRRAPLLVRAAALACFYWSWFSVVGWLGVGLLLRASPAVLAVAGAGIVVAVCNGVAGGKLLRRDRRAVRSGRLVAVVTAAFMGTLLLGAATLGDADLGGVAMLFGGLSLGQACLLVAALRRHGPLFGELAPAPAAARVG